MSSFILKTKLDTFLILLHSFNPISYGGNVNLAHTIYFFWGVEHFIISILIKFDGPLSDNQI